MTERIPLFNHSQLLQGISTKEDGNIDARFGPPKEVKRNRQNFLRKLGVNPSQVVEMEQVHKTEVVRVDKSDKGTILEGADGAITNIPEVVLMLRIADCIPVFLCDPRTKAIGLLHSGWKGSVGKIILVAIQRMMLEFQTNPADLRLALGPSIQACCNIWKKPALELELPEWSPFITKSENSYALDLPGFVKITALNAGVKEENIEVSSMCTVMDQTLFSFKRSQEAGEPEGRFAAVIGLKA